MNLSYPSGDPEVMERQLRNEVIPTAMQMIEQAREKLSFTPEPEYGKYCEVRDRIQPLLSDVDINLTHSPITTKFLFLAGCVTARLKMVTEQQEKELREFLEDPNALEDALRRGVYLAAKRLRDKT